MSELPDFSQFESLLEESFTLYFNSGDIFPITLTEATRLRDQVPAGRSFPFQLKFYGQSHICLPQGIYQLFHANLGMFELFLVPVGQIAGGFTYQAIFN